MAENYNAPAGNHPDRLSDLYNQHFTPAVDAVRGAAPAQAAVQFKIFSLTDNSVHLVYSNNTQV